MRNTLIITAIAATATLAHAQTVGVTIEIDEPILAPGDSTRVRLIASFPAGDWAFASTNLDLLIESRDVDPLRAISDLSVLPPMAAGPSSGRVTARGIEGIIAGQLNFPPAGIYADPTNPIPFYEFTFRAPDDGGGYRVDLSTLTSRFDAYPTRESSVAESRLDLVVEDAASIFVVPAPPSVAALLIGLAATRRRRSPAA